MAETAEVEPKTAKVDQTAPADQSVEVSTVDLPEAQERAVTSGGGQIEILLDSTVPMDVSLGRRQLTIREALELGPGSVVQLDRQIGEPVDLYLRGVRFATGHMVVVGDQLGVRIKEILQAVSGVQ